LEAEGLMVADSRFEGLSLALYEVRKQNRILHESFSYVGVQGSLLRLGCEIATTAA